MPKEAYARCDRSARAAAAAVFVHVRITYARQTVVHIGVLRTCSSSSDPEPKVRCQPTTRHHLAPWPSPARVEAGRHDYGKSKSNGGYILRKILNTPRELDLQSSDSRAQWIPYHGHFEVPGMFLSHAHQRGVWCSSSPRRVHPIHVYVVLSLITSSARTYVLACFCHASVRLTKRRPLQEEPPRSGTDHQHNIADGDSSENAGVWPSSFSKHAHVNPIVPNDSSSFAPTCASSVV